MAKVNSNFDKARNVTFNCYLKDWKKKYGELLEYLDGLAIPCACSPIHDEDKYTAEDINKWVRRHTDDDGVVDPEAIKKGMPQLDQNKKEHVHVLMCANGPQQAQWFYELMRDFHEITYFERVNSVPAMLRYFAHMDSPQKHRYSELGIHGFGGIDLSPLLKSNEVSNLETLLDVLDYVRTNKVRHYYKLVHWAIGTGEMETLSCVTGRASFFANYFKSATDDRREKAEKEKEKERLAQGLPQEEQNNCSSQIDF